MIQLSQQMLEASEAWCRLQIYVLNTINANLWIQTLGAADAIYVDAGWIGKKHYVNLQWMYGSDVSDVNIKGDSRGMYRNGIHEYLWID